MIKTTSRPTHFFVKELVPIRVASKCVITIAREVYAMLQWTVRLRESYVISGAFKFKGVIYKQGIAFGLEGKVSCSFLSGCLNVGREALEYVSNIASTASNIEYDTSIEVALSSCTRPSWRTWATNITWNVMSMGFSSRCSGFLNQAV